MHGLEMLAFQQGGKERTCTLRTWQEPTTYLNDILAPGQYTVINPSHIGRRQVFPPLQLLIKAELAETAEC